jgi:ceramide glucosyltransferase
MAAFAPELVMWLWGACAIMAVLGCLYALFAAASLDRLSASARPRSVGPAPSVSILKPLYGAEPGLLENLASFVRQDYRGPVEMLCGVHDSADPAADVVRELVRRQPGADVRLLADPTLHGSNRKISSLINLAGAARGKVILLADSDVRVPPDYLVRVIEALQQPGVGLVTCLYRGLPAAGPWSRLLAMAIDDHFLPSVLVGLRLGLAEPCFGSTIALRRQTLARIGGFEVVADRLADDYAIGAAVRALGLEVAIPPMVVAHVCSEPSFAALMAHEIRWARTIRLVDPKGFAGSIVTHPLPFALLALLLQPGRIGLGLLLASLACRVWLQLGVGRALGHRAGPPWLGPVRDLLSFAVFVASLWPSAVRWRGDRYRVGRDGTLR